MFLGAWNKRSQTPCHNLCNLNRDLSRDVPLRRAGYMYHLAWIIFGHFPESYKKLHNQLCHTPRLFKRQWIEHIRTIRNTYLMSLIGDGIGPFTPRKGIQFQESGKIFLGFVIRNTTQGIRNPTNDWNPKSKFYWQRPKTGIRNPRQGIPDSGLSWIPLHGVKPLFLHDYFSYENVCPLE